MIKYIVIICLLAVVAGFALRENKKVVEEPFGATAGFTIADTTTEALDLTVDTAVATTFLVILDEFPRNFSFYAGEDKIMTLDNEMIREMSAEQLIRLAALASIMMHLYHDSGEAELKVIAKKLMPEYYK